MSKKDQATDKYLRKHYGISLAEFRCVLKFQDGCCAICKKPRKPGAPRLAVDHCHKSGKLRGALCFRCNKLLLGAFNDNVAMLQAAVEYLSNPPITRVLGERITAPGRIGTKKRAKLLSQIGANVRQEPNTRSSRGK